MTSNEVFYSAPVFNALGQVLTDVYGNGVTNTYAYYANSKRLQNLKAVKNGGTLQNLDYTYDKVSNVKSINDNFYTGTASASLSSINYDDLHRLIGYTRPTISTTYTFTYSANGNTTLNDELSAGSSYTYGSSKPHAVTSAGGRTYSYDACGNMTNRNGAALLYDEENQMTQYGAITFGYTDGGARLWKNNGGQLTIWIGGIYEIKGGKTLCHVFAGGKRVATFEPSGQFCTWLYQHPWLGKTYDTLVACLDWPLKEGRTPLTATLIPLLGILTASVGSRWRRRLSRYSGDLACGRWV